MKRIILVGISFIFVVGSVLYTSHLAEELSLEEQKKVTTWAEATKRIITAEDEDEIDFLLGIIEGNTTIPVFMTDSMGTYLFSRNVKLPKKLQPSAGSEPNIDEDLAAAQQAYFQSKVDDLKLNSTPIEVRLPGDILQYIYYDQSNTLVLLQWLPYMQFLLIIVFLVVAITTITASKRAEENLVWVGLSKETAHQLGTPISSLNGWNELLKLQYPDNSAFVEIDKDIQRLTTVTERFSKIGSVPALEKTDLQQTIEEAMQYMQTRTSDKVSFQFRSSCPAHMHVLLNKPLFAWVIENLIRNSIDAMNGTGQITITLHQDKDHAIIDVTDTGKGIERKRWRKVFDPGHTTKQRGWGLGLSLAKRIIHQYHHGKIYVLSSEIGKGTTFRIEVLF